VLNRSERKEDKILHDLGTLWAMEHGQERSRCSLMTRASAWRLHLIINGQSVKSERCRRGAAAFDLADEWKRRMREQGWRQVVPRPPVYRSTASVQLRLVEAPAR
jgi:hypothetical protein